MGAGQIVFHRLCDCRPNHIIGMNYFHFGHSIQQYNLEGPLKICIAEGPPSINM